MRRARAASDKGQPGWARLSRRRLATAAPLLGLLFLSVLAPHSTCAVPAPDSTLTIPQPSLLDSGAVAPDFELSDQHGARVRASSLWKAAPLVVYFYPADFTPGCTKEAHAFELERPAIEEAGAHLLAISVNDVESHSRFAEHCGAGFAMLADSDAVVARAYGAELVLGEADRTHSVARRVSYLLGPGGVVWQRWIVSDPMLHPKEVRAALLARVSSKAK